MIIAPLLLNFGWRSSLLILISLAAIVLVPSLISISPVAKYHATQKAIASTDVSTENYLFTGKFWLIASNIFVGPFLCTAIFLYQFGIAESKGWEAGWVTFSFAFFAIFNALALLVSGNLVDKFGGKRLFPLYLIPILIALIAMAISSSQWVFPLFYALLGISTGLGSTIKTALQVVVYGKSKLGKIRSYFSTILVFSTALGPPAFGFFIDRNYSFNGIMAIAAVFVTVIFLLSFRVWKIVKK